ncbi:MAG: hypothetical protein IJT38_05485 [Clostridia bacterium]|nr:hypothetical protein [Clostridia bacterium]
MSEQFYDLFDLLEEDFEAEEFYQELPEYVREFIEDRADTIRNLDDLRRCADNFL